MCVRCTVYDKRTHQPTATPSSRAALQASRGPHRRPQPDSREDSSRTQCRNRRPKVCRLCGSALSPGKKESSCRCFERVELFGGGFASSLSDVARYRSQCSDTRNCLQGVPPHLSTPSQPSPSPSPSRPHTPCAHASPGSATIHPAHTPLARTMPYTARCARRRQLAASRPSHVPNPRVLCARVGLVPLVVPALALALASRAEPAAASATPG